MTGYKIYSTNGVMKDASGKEVTYPTLAAAEMHAANMSRLFGAKFTACYCD